MGSLKRTALLLLAAGIAACIGGVAWGVFCIGVPYPDPTPAQRAQEAFDLRVSTTCLAVGLLVMLSSGVVFVCGWLLKLRRSQVRRRSPGGRPPLDPRAT